MVNKTKHKKFSGIIKIERRRMGWQLTLWMLSIVNGWQEYKLLPTYRHLQNRLTLVVVFLIKDYLFKPLFRVNNLYPNYFF